MAEVLMDFPEVGEYLQNYGSDADDYSSLLRSMARRSPS
jgi:hypothetical protein